MRWGPAIGLWLGLGLSLGWYYTFTYYGRSGWPMPLPDCCAALILYYFSVLNAPTEIQAVHWMLVFPMAGILWVFALWGLAPFFGGRRPAFDRTLFRISLASLPLVAPAAWMTYIAGNTADGFTRERMFLVALRRANVSPWTWLSPLYLALGLLALALQVYLYRKSFGLHCKKAWQHFMASAILLTVLACVVGALAGMPLRLCFE